MKEINHLFIITTTYHLFNILNICDTSIIDKKESDILIVDFGIDIESKIDIEILKSIFANVYFYKIKVQDEIRIRQVKKAFSILLHKRFGINIKQRYKSIFIPGAESYTKELAFTLSKPGFTLNYYEDGLGTYTNALDIEKVRKENIFKFAYKIAPTDYCSNVYVYKPDYMICNTLNKNLIQIRVDKERQKDWIRVFRGNINEIDEKFIFFGQWYLSREEYQFQKELIEQIMNVIPHDYLCYKLHPSKTDEQLQSVAGTGIKIIDNSNPFEIVNHYYSMRSKVLISVQSTAVSSPKMIFDEEPTVIYLYNIFSNRFPGRISNNVMRAGEKLKEIYKCGSVYCPKDMAEFLQILHSLKGETDA